MAARIAGHPSVFAQYAQQLVAEGVVTEAQVEELAQGVRARLKAAHEQLKETFGQSIPAKSRDEVIPPAERQDEIDTDVPAERLRELNAQLIQAPDGFTVHPKLLKQLERRIAAIDEGGIDWGHAEALAFASLVTEAVPIRLTGQDSERGTFAQRHLMLHDARTGETYAPMQHLPGAGASFEVRNSPLSEAAALGFEYGYTTSAAETLVLWEAQYGDFVNAAQVIIDQFIVAGLSKWRQTSGLTLLLPHGYEGSGPEHSSARLERFLQLAAQENITVVNPTTAAQYFHLLRRQALARTGRPLIVMTPKALLRLRGAAARLEELSDGTFQHLIDDPRGRHAAARRLVLCSGKLYYDIAGHELYGGASTSLSPGSSSSTPSPPSRRGTCSPGTRASTRSSGPGGTAEHGRLADDPPPHRGSPAGRRHAPLRRPPVARQPERGLSHRASARAGPHRQRSASRGCTRVAGLSPKGLSSVI